jgi:hypothetical protein
VLMTNPYNVCGSVRSADSFLFSATFAASAVNPSVKSVNRADGISEIEGKAAKGSGERVWETSEFQIRGSHLYFVSIHFLVSFFPDSTKSV